MKVRIFSYTVLSLLFFTGLDITNAQIPYEYSEPVIGIESEVIEVETEIYDPRAMEIADDVLIVTDAGNLPSVHLFSIVGPGQLEYTGGFGKEGRGPGEFLGAWDIVKTPGSIYIYDAGTRRLLPYDMEFNHNPGGIITLRTDGVPVNLHYLDDKFYVTGITIDGRIEIINRSGETVDKLYQHHDLEMRERINNRTLAGRWHSYSTISPDGSRIALFARMAAHVDLLTIEGEQLRILKDKEKGLPATQLIGQNAADGPGAIRGYISVTSDDNYIYALYSGSEAGSPDSSLGRFIHKFDWDLNIIDIFELDHLSIAILKDDENGIYSLQHYPEVNIRYIDTSDL